MSSLDSGDNVHSNHDVDSEEEIYEVEATETADEWPVGEIEAEMD